MLVTDEMLYRCTKEVLQTNSEYCREVRRSITVEFIDSFSHPELNELYDTIDAIQHNSNEDTMSCPRRESIQSDISLGSDYIEVKHFLQESRANQSRIMFEGCNRNATIQYLPGNENLLTNSTATLEGNEKQ